MFYRVPNALPGRGSVNVEIFGMAGVPDGAAPGITVPIGTELELAPPCCHCCLMLDSAQQHINVLVWCTLYRMSVDLIE